VKNVLVSNFPRASAAALWLHQAPLWATREIYDLKIRLQTSSCCWGLYITWSKKQDRTKSLSEAFQALKPDGLLFAASISRFASALDGLFRNFIQDTEFFKIVRRDLKLGQHRNPTNRSEYFTTAFLPSAE